ncbi:diguanylate cyclase [Euzebya sp.]|uniref:GGDEF domain-containing protein n=1 Tax=Euzebya sp. TaxID=1971409 RepID=UPI003511A75B
MDDQHRSLWWLQRWRVAAVVAVIGLAAVTADLGLWVVLDRAGLGSSPGGIILRAIAGTLAMAWALWAVLVRPFQHQLAAAERTRRDQQAQLVADAHVSDLDSSLSRALGMAATEDGVLEVTSRALSMITPDEPAELLLADNSQASLRVATASAAGPAGCEVGAPGHCAAARLGRTMTFTDAEALDACPHLRGRGQIAATCVPVSVMGQTIGVVHTTRPARTPLAGTRHAELEVLVHQVGSRLGLLRALAHSELQAATDQLTGLANRRTFESRVERLTAAGTPFVVALGDLDRFKLINDTHGHDAGDQALRAAAKALSSGIRGNDLAARYGGEEFVVLLADCSLEQGLVIVDRLREGVSLTTSGGAIPQVTISFGLAHSSMAIDIEALMRLADVALFDAKREGRDRVVVAQGPVAEAPLAETPQAETAPEPEAAPRAPVVVGGVA